MKLSRKDRSILQYLQDDFPLVCAPFEKTAQKFGMDETALLARLKALESGKVIRYLGVIFDPQKLGISSVLCAVRVPAGKVERTARLISATAGVSHNYLRSGSPNIWFTLSCRSAAACRRTVADISRKIGFPVMALPSRRVFKIDARFAVAGKTAKRDDCRGIQKPPIPRRLILILNRPFPLAARPFRALARQAGISEERMIGYIRSCLASGLVRRCGLILSHRSVGLKANCMAVWNVPCGRLQETARLFCRQKEITHCYLRAPARGWPYTVYTMIHCATMTACKRLLRRLSRDSGVKDFLPLFTLKEFKKTKAELAKIL